MAPVVSDAAASKVREVKEIISAAAANSGKLPKAASARGLTALDDALEEVRRLQSQVAAPRRALGRR